MKGSSRSLQIWAQCLVRAKREGIINRRCVLQLANSFWALRYGMRLTMFKEAGRAVSRSEDVPGSRSTPDKPQSSFRTGGRWEELSFSWTWLAWGTGCRGGLGLQWKNRQLIFGSRWGAALSTGAAQMPLKQSKHQLSWDTGTRWSLLIPSHSQPSHLLSHPLRVITHGTGWAHDGCWETRTEIRHDVFL